MKEKPLYFHRRPNSDANPRRDRPKLLKQEVPAQQPNGRQQV